MSDPDARWSALGLAGVLGLCCVGFGSLALGGAAVAGVTVADGTIGSPRGLFVTAVATLLPLVVVGLALRYRRS